MFTGTRVESIEPGTPLTVRLSNGKTMQADLVISAAGVRPAIEYVENSGISCLLGVLTDEHLQTNVPGIYVAGDCWEAFDNVSGKMIVSAIQPNAAESFYAERFEREMGCTEAEWLGWLPSAMPS